VVEVVAASTGRSEDVVVVETTELLVVVQSSQMEFESLEFVQLPVPL
jgi:hypothetical protein